MRLVDIQSGEQQLDVRAVVLTADKFEDLELLIPCFRLLEVGARVDIAAPAMEDISGEHGYRMAPHLRIADVDPALYGLLLVPGGFPDGAPATVRQLPEAQAIAAAFMSGNKPVASICHGPWLLASADLVRGRRLMSYWHDGVPQDIKDAGGLWEDSAVVVDGNLVTSRWPPDLPVFVAEMMKLIEDGTGSAPSR